MNPIGGAGSDAGSFLCASAVAENVRLRGKGTDVLYFSELSHCFRIYFR